MPSVQGCSREVDLFPLWQPSFWQSPAHAADANARGSAASSHEFVALKMIRHLQLGCRLHVSYMRASADDSRALVN